jgi:hypothetical protein
MFDFARIMGGTEVTCFGKSLRFCFKINGALVSSYLGSAAVWNRSGVRLGLGLIHSPEIQ